MCPFFSVFFCLIFSLSLLVLVDRSILGRERGEEKASVNCYYDLYEGLDGWQFHLGTVFRGRWSDRNYGNKRRRLADLWVSSSSSLPTTTHAHTYCFTSSTFIVVLIPVDMTMFLNFD
uniref:Secreted protein n=1 Tax=Trypanosoma congolense (strain IL3000) TaxID=1068625 RepID=G0UTN8_TRYCI|nr:hypothetical protein, unlikely [Trypanosoma congolense IL3000]